MRSTLPLPGVGFRSSHLNTFISPPYPATQVLATPLHTRSLAPPPAFTSFQHLWLAGHQDTGRNDSNLWREGHQDGDSDDGTPTDRSDPPPASFWGRGTKEVNELEPLQKFLWDRLDHDDLDRRKMLDYAFPDSLCYFCAEATPGVKGYVALTIDDVPARFGVEASYVGEVRQLLKRFGATATFFVMSDFVKGHERELGGLVADGSELQNHAQRDRNYYWDSEADFEAALLESQTVLDSFGPPSRRWFRAPKGLQSTAMKEVLQRHGYLNVMFDRYALDTEISDPSWIADSLLNNIESGSVLLIHIPERGFREWNLRALELLLEGLRLRNLRAVSVSDLANLADAAWGNASSHAPGAQSAPRPRPHGRAGEDQPPRCFGKNRKRGACC